MGGWGAAALVERGGFRLLYGTRDGISSGGDLRGDSSSRLDNKSEADAVFFFLARVPRAAGATAPTTAFFTVLFFFIGTTTGEKGSLEVLAMGDWIASKRLAGDTQLDYGGARVFICVLYIVPCFQEKIHFNTLI